MNSINKILGMRTALLLLFVISSACLGFGQTKDSKEAPSQTIDARQSGEWNVGIDPVKNVVRLQNSSSDPLPVTVVYTSGRRPYHVSAGISVFAGGPSSGTEVHLQIPTGKRFVIEDVSARTEIPQGESIELSFLTRLEPTSNSISVYHFVPLTAQGVFADTTVFAASYKNTGLCNLPDACQSQADVALRNWLRSSNFFRLSRRFARSVRRKNKESGGYPDS